MTWISIPMSQVFHRLKKYPCHPFERSVCQRLKSETSSFAKPKLALQRAVVAGPNQQVTSESGRRPLSELAHMRGFASRQTHRLSRPLLKGLGFRFGWKDLKSTVGHWTALSSLTVTQSHENEPNRNGRNEDRVLTSRTEPSSYCQASTCARRIMACETGIGRQRCLVIPL